MPQRNGTALARVFSVLDYNIKGSHVFRDAEQSIYSLAEEIPDFLDRAMRSGRNLHISNHHLHPWLFFVDIGIIAVLLLAYLFSRIFEGIAFFKILLVFTAVYPAYEAIFLKIKRRAFHIKGESSRSYLQDSLIFLIPAFLFGSWAMGISVRASADFLGLMFPLFFGFVRIGCFLGGCCYGVSWKYGVLYPKKQLSDPEGCRKYAASPSPGCRVLPIQLMESFVNFSLFALLFLRLYITQDLSGSTLPLYFVFYGIYRIVSDLFRKVSARPRRGPFSEAQIISFFLVLVSLVYLLRAYL